MRVMGVKGKARGVLGIIIRGADSKARRDFKIATEVKSIFRILLKKRR